MHTFASIYVHVTFSTWNRHPFITTDFRTRFHAYVASTARGLGMHEVEVGGVDDHLHLLARFDPAASVSNAIGQLKKSTGDFARDERTSAFRWQRGFAAFSVSIDRVPVVVRYIRRQEEHHHKRSFAQELEALLREFGVPLADVHLL